MGEAEESLDAYLNEMGDGLDTEAPDELRDADRVNAMLGAMHTLQARMAADKALAERQKAKIDHWLETRNAIDQRTYDNLEKTVTDWHAAIVRLNPTRTFISLPNGELKARKQPDEWVVDDAAFLAYQNPWWPAWGRRLKSEVDRNGIKKLPEQWKIVNSKVVDSSGNEVPGVTVVCYTAKRFTAKPA